MTLRSWATPLVIGAFLVMAVSGVLMFFHLNTGLMKGIHEWAGLVMVAGGIAHLILNWRPFMAYLRRPLARAIMALGVVALGLSFLPIAPKGMGPGPEMRALAGVAGKLRVEVLAELSGQTPEVLVARLAAGGVTDVTPQQTLADLAGGDAARQRMILGLALPRD
ncbi:hypothetical protein CCR83_06475 [Rhodobacter veldkampii DSM 11550]|uniref:Flavinylation-associated cytochrome domain-containing protein n=1 Tax=Phaeovulum veldkampii DSM 11550 TaxID=1185920 RepID=A0A2T4JJZ0_9RHOB|nr:DUF4405 domain-containing protein [Phaeovulum veldkampii]MBK5946103.1 hypothetical protein [Phaeovulum veldkampii DSM 11550]PTE18202.1 hypothetical protein C5F46_05585 [Phaeovulum veldkampii DSM 11550]TDQ63497.1 uncharacterized protein DUF4405 [Phaeovulum veldkampii DSM 11550]